MCEGVGECTCMEFSKQSQLEHSVVDCQVVQHADLKYAVWWVHSPQLQAITVVVSGVARYFVYMRH